MPRRASCAARTVPEKPPPTIATDVLDFIIRPVLRICRVRFPSRHMVVHVADGFSGGLGEPAGHHGMNETGEPGADERGADRDRSNPVTAPAHPERARMIEEQPL